MSCCRVFFVSCCVLLAAVPPARVVVFALVAAVPPVVVFALVPTVPPVVVFVGAFARRLLEVVAALRPTRVVLLCCAAVLVRGVVT